MARVTIPPAALKKRLPAPAELIRPWKGPPPPLLVVDSDNHYGSHDERFQAAKLQLARDLQPDAWLNLGDHYDFQALSRFDHDPATITTIQDELDGAWAYWEEVCNHTDKVEFILGNHEDRLYRTIIANAGLFGLRALTDWHTLADIPRKVKIHPYGTQRQIGLLWGEHGDQIKGKNPTHWAMDNREGRVIAFGHTHRKGYYSRTRRNERGQIVTREVYNTGHGSSVRQAARWAGTVPNWQHSFLVARHFRAAGGWEIAVDSVKAESGVISYGGKTYRG